METIYKVLDCEVKKLGERSYEFTASTSTQDRDGEVIEASGWDLKNYKKNPVVMYAHDYRTLPIGKSTRVWISKDGQLKNTVEFPPEGTYEFADIVERLVDTGYLKTESVGFIPKKWEDGDGEKSPKRTYTKQELLEISIVPVPSNPDALRNALDDGVITTKEFNAISEPEKVEDHKTFEKLRQVKNYPIGGIEEKEPPQAKEIWETKTLIAPEISPEDYEKRLKELHPTKEISQQGVLDELDYLIRCLDTVGLNEEAVKSAWELVREVMRLTGDDIPEDIAEKIGAVLNQKNKDRLTQIQSLAQGILDSAAVQESIEEVLIDKELIGKLVKAEINKLQGKI